MKAKEKKTRQMRIPRELETGIRQIVEVYRDLEKRNQNLEKHHEFVQKTLAIKD